MQSLWSRASQATSRCGCRACNTVAHSAGRRVAPPRRKPTFAEIFTAAYTSVFASAAVLDSGFKEKRRRELDQKLEDAKHDLAVLKQRNDISLGAKEELEAEANLNWLTDHQMSVLWQTIKLTRPYSAQNETDAALLRHSATRQQLQRSHYNCDGSSLPTLWDQTEQDRIDQAILYEDANPPSDQRNPITDRQLHEFGSDIVILVKKMVQRAKEMDPHRTKKSSPSLELVEQMLASKERPWYHHSSMDPEAARNTVRDLNRACRSAILRSELGVQEQVGRVCYNLMVSKYAPDITTMNTLISSFNRPKKLRGFSHLVTWENFSWFKFKPTASTLAASLHHYRSIQDHESWKRLLKGIVGCEDRFGAKYMRRHVRELEMGPGLWQWASETHLRTRTKKYIYDHAPLNPLMVEQILHGLLSFGRLGSCLTFFISCALAQVPVTARMTKAVMNECVAALDWKSALDLVQHMVRYGQLWWSLISNMDSSNIGYLIDRMYSILDMIGLGDSADFASEERLEHLGLSKEGLATLFESLDQTNEALKPKERARRTRGPVRLDDATRATRSRALQIESLDKELSRTALRAKRTDEALFSLEVPLSEPLLTHASNVALAKGQALSNEVVEVLSLLRTTTKDERWHEGVEALGKETVPYWTEMSSRERFTALNNSQFRASLDWKFGSMKFPYGQTVSAKESGDLPPWITSKEETPKEPEVEQEKKPKVQKPAPARQPEARSLKSAVSREEKEAQARVMKSNLAMLDQIDLQMRSQRRAAYS